MKPEDVAALVRGLVPAIRSLVETTKADLVPRILALESAPAPATGPAGPPGPSGPPGPAGRDGEPVLTWDDLAFQYDGVRTVTITKADGTPVARWDLPIPIPRGPYEDGTEYQPGDLVFAAHAVWLCKTATTLKPNHVSRDETGSARGPQGKDFWTLYFRGRA